MRLLSVAVLLCAVLAAGESEPVCLARGNFDSNVDFRSILARELIRQSFLIAARDELGLTTRDEVLGEALAAPGPANLAHVFSIDTKLDAAMPAGGIETIPSRFLRPLDGDKKGLSATYYHGMNFETEVLKRIDAQIGFRWGNGKPAEAVNADKFSVRWEGFVEAPADGAYTFIIQSDDGVRLWVNGEKLVDEWRDMGPTSFMKEIVLKAGKVPIKIEYFDNSGGAEIALAWRRPLSAQKTNAKLRVTLKRGDKALGEPLQAELPWPGPEFYRGLLTQCSEWSRTVFPARLKDAGLFASTEPQAAPPLSAARLDELQTAPNLSSQYLALRLLHNATRAKENRDNDAGLLARMALGYVLFAWTIDNNPTAAPKVCEARALLYGRRAKERAKPGTPAAAEAQFAQGCALTHSGFQAWGLKEFAAGREAWGAGTPVPGWAEMMQRYAARDIAELDALSNPAPWGAWGAVLHADAIGTAEVTGEREKQLRRHLANYPDNDMLYDALTGTDGLSSLHISTRERPVNTRAHFARTLASIPGLPEMKDLPSRGQKQRLSNSDLVEVQRALVKTGFSDRLEPSLQVLQAQFSNDCLWQVGRRARFMASEWAVGLDSVRQYLDEDEMLLEGNPFRPLLKMYRLDWGSQRAAIKKELESVRFPDLNTRMLFFFQAIVLPIEESAPLNMNSRMIAAASTDWNSFGMIALMNQPGTLHESYLKWAAELDPKSPSLHMYSIWFLGARDPKIVAEMEKRTDLVPQVIETLVRFYQQRNNSLKVMEWQEKLVKLRPDLEQLSKLAWQYREAGNDKKYFELMEQALEFPDQGLGHARLNTQMASVLRRNGDFKRAVKHAEKAAQSWAQWAMQEAVWCYEGDGQYDAALKWSANLSERYENPDWYFQAVVYGKDKTEALEMIRDQLKKRAAEKMNARAYNTQGWMQYLEGDSSAAIASIEAAYKDYPNANDAATLAGLYAQTNNVAKRDEWLALAQKGKPEEYKDTRKTLSMIEKALKAAQPLPKDEIMRAAKACELRWEKPALLFSAGHLLLQAGEKAEAIELFRSGMNAPTCEVRYKAACAHSLRALGDPAELKMPAPPADKNAPAKPPKAPGDF